MTSLILLKGFLTTQIELWRPAPGYAGYEISNLGNLRSYYHRIATRHPTKGRWGIYFIYVIGSTPRTLKWRPDKDGYLAASLFVQSKPRTMRAHRLVALAFIPNKRPDARLVNHKNNIKYDNRVDNLEWCTSKENNLHAMRIGVSPTGEKSRYAKLTEEDVRRIRKRIASGDSNAQIALDYPVTPQAIRFIRTGENWGFLA